MVAIPTVQCPHSSCDIPAPRAVPVFHGEVPVPGDEHNAAIPCCHCPVSSSQRSLCPDQPLSCSQTAFPLLQMSLHQMPDHPSSCPAPIVLSFSLQHPSVLSPPCTLEIRINPRKMFTLVPKKVQCHPMEVAPPECPARLELCGDGVGQGPPSELLLLLQKERDAVEDMEVDMALDMEEEMEIDVDEHEEEMEVDMNEEEEEMEVEEEGDKEEAMVLG